MIKFWSGSPVAQPTGSGPPARPLTGSRWRPSSIGSDGRRHSPDRTASTMTMTHSHSPTTDSPRTAPHKPLSQPPKLGGGLLRPPICADVRAFLRPLRSWASGVRASDVSGASRAIVIYYILCAFYRLILYFVVCVRGGRTYIGTCARGADG